MKKIERIITLLILFSFLSTEKIDAQNSEIDIYTINDEVIIDFNPYLCIIRISDKDIFRNFDIIYKPESDVIINLDEIETSQVISDILDKPFNELNLKIFSDYNINRVFNGIQELLEIFNIELSNDIIEKINIIAPYRQIIKITINSIDLYLYRENLLFFKLFIVEYKKNFSFEPIIKIGDNKSKILTMLGNPSGYSDERNLFIYQSFKTSRQIVIFFENDIIKFIQLVSWGGP